MNDYLKHISKIEKNFNLSINNDLKSLVNYKDYKNLKFQNWCNYQEGFSQNIFDWFLNHNKIKKSSGIFFDPFCGSGSSLISAKNNGFEVIGIDINPFSTLLTETKIEKYSKRDIQHIKDFKVPTYREIKKLYNKFEFSMVRKLYSRKNFTKIELLKRSINKVNNKKAKRFLFTALTCCLESSSYYRKAGNGLKKRKNIIEVDFFYEFKQKKQQMLEDIKYVKNHLSHKVICGNINKIEKIIDVDSVDISLFSPPYPNCFDYFEVYKIELWIGEFIKSYEELKKLRKTAITSNLNADLKRDVSSIDIKNLSNLLFLTMKYLKKEDLWNKNIPRMLILYFYEMDIFIKKLYKIIRKGGNVGIVIGNSSYGGIPIISDLILAEIAKQNKFKVKEIIVARNNETASQQYKKISKLIKYIRESVIIIEK